MKFYYSTTLKIDDHIGFHLIQDHIGTNYSSPWNDYGFTVTFKVLHVQESGRKLLGSIKLLAKGYADTSKYLIEFGESLEDRKIYDVTNALVAEKVVSLASNIDFYKAINVALSGTDAVTEFLEGICDGGYLYQNYSDYETWDGFHSAVLRDGSAAEAILKKGYMIAIGNYRADSRFEIVVDTLDTFDPIEFSFVNGGALGNTNINLLIGKNGSGKSHLLKYLSELLTGLHKKNKVWPYFHKLVVVAYSPFENYYTKDGLFKALDQINNLSESKSPSAKKSLKRRLLNINEYAYIGFKNEEDQFALDWPKIHSARSLIEILEFDNKHQWWSKISRFDTLINTLKLCIDFDQLGLKNESNEIVSVDIDNISKYVKTKFNFEEGIFFLKNGRILSLSSGQNIYSYMLTCLVAEIQEESLIIIDEPELYLHPSLEIGLISMLKSILKETSSYALIATHSALMAREVEKKGITILKRGENYSTNQQPSFETFGESLELIIGETFDDFLMKKPYQKRLDSVLEEINTVEEAIRTLGPSIGDEALAYVASKYATNEVTFQKLPPQ